jgi:hypothetical protein
LQLVYQPQVNPTQHNFVGSEPYFGIASYGWTIQIELKRAGDRENIETVKGIVEGRSRCSAAVITPGRG